MMPPADLGELRPRGERMVQVQFKVPPAIAARLKAEADLLNCYPAALARAVFVRGLEQIAQT